MDYSDYSYSAATQAAFFKAEAALLRLDARFENSPFAKNLKNTLLAIDAMFAVRMSHEITLPVVPLITAFDLSEWQQYGDIEQGIGSYQSFFAFPKDSLSAAREALHYMQAIDWIAHIVHPDAVVTMNTVLQLHEILISGTTHDNRFHGFRRTFLEHKKGFDPVLIPSAVNDLCGFINTDLFSPLGQASVVHHAFERIVPFDSMVDRTGLTLAFLAMFKRGLFTNGYMVPICWGASINRERRRKMKDASRDTAHLKTYVDFREYWAAHNANNTYLSAVITNSFFNVAGSLRAKWRSQGFHIPTNSALDRLLDLLLGTPEVFTKRAADAINKSYGATYEALGQLVKAGIVRETALDGRKRMFVCDQSAAIITDFVDKLVVLSQKDDVDEAKYNKELAISSGI